MNRRGLFALLLGASALPLVAKVKEATQSPFARADLGRGCSAVGTPEFIARNIDARVASEDLIARLPEILRANNDEMKRDILDLLARRPLR